MALAGKIAAIELSQQVQNRFVGNYFEGRLINAPGEVYTPGTTNDATFLANEVVDGLGGYERQVLYYQNVDVSNYTDGGVGLAQKATVFAHDGSDDAVDFTHVALCWSDKSATGLVPLTNVGGGQTPNGAIDGTFYDIPFDLTDGNGRGLTINMTVINGGLVTGDYSIAISKPGYGIEAGDSFTILETTLLGAGVVTAGAGPLQFVVDTVLEQPNAGQLVAVAKTANTVTLVAGNEAAFYWNLKQYGYYESLLAI